MIGHLPAAISPIATIINPASTLFSFLQGVSIFFGVVIDIAAALFHVGLLPQQLSNITNSYYTMRKAIELQRLVNTPGPKQKDYQLYSLLKKKCQFRDVAIEHGKDPDSDYYFTPPEATFFRTPQSRQQLLRQKELTKQIGKNERWDAAWLIFIGLLGFSASVAGCIFIFSAALGTINLLPGILSFSSSTLIGFMSIFSVVPYVVPTSVWLYHGLKNMYHCITLENAINQMIDNKIAALPAECPNPPPALDMKLEPRMSPKPVTTPKFELESKVISVSDSTQEAEAPTDIQHRRSCST